MVKILTAVRTDGLQAVEAACAEAPALRAPMSSSMPLPDGSGERWPCPWRHRHALRSVYRRSPTAPAMPGCAPQVGRRHLQRSGILEMMTTLQLAGMRLTYD
jgi:hypothetical protein